MGQLKRIEGSIFIAYNNKNLFLLYNLIMENKELLFTATLIRDELMIIKLRIPFF